jgi:hypothetical protein
MRAVSMENSDRWAMVSTQYQLPTPLPRHSTAICFRDSFACSWRIGATLAGVIAEV